MEANSINKTMEKFELRDDNLFSVSEILVDGIDPEREIALMEDDIRKLEDKIKVLKSYKAKKDAKSVSGTTTGKDEGNSNKV